MDKHQKGVNPKLHFPPYSLLNKVPAFIRQPNCQKKKKISYSLPSSSSSLFSDNPETISGRRGEWLGPVALLPASEQPFTDKPKPRIPLQPPGAAASKTTCKRQGQDSGHSRNGGGAFPSPTIFTFNYYLLPLLPDRLK